MESSMDVKGEAERICLSPTTIGGLPKFRLVVIEGNIGVGKTSVLDVIEAMGFKVFREAIDEMQPFLERMYNGTDRSSDILQLCVGVQQMRIVKEIIAILKQSGTKCDKNGVPVFFVERWVGSAEHVFIKSARSAEHISITSEGIKLWRDMLLHSGVSSVPVSTYLYISADPEIAYRRIVKRSEVRTSERAMQKEYIVSLHRLYEGFIKTLREKGEHVVTVSNETSVSDVEGNINAALAEIGVNPDVQHFSADSP